MAVNATDGRTHPPCPQCHSSFERAVVINVAWSATHGLVRRMKKDIIVVRPVRECQHHLFCLVQHHIHIARHRIGMIRPALPKANARVVVVLRCAIPIESPLIWCAPAWIVDWILRPLVHKLLEVTIPYHSAWVGVWHDEVRGRSAARIRASRDIRQLVERIVCGRNAVHAVEA